MENVEELISETIEDVPKIEILRRYCDALRKAIVPHLEGVPEKMTFDVRPGVSFVDIEFFLNDRVTAFRSERIETVMRNGTIDTFARGVLARLRERHPVLRPADSYRRIDVMREMLAILESVVQKKCDAREYIRITRGIVHQVEGTLPTEVLYPKNSKTPSYHYYKLMVDGLVEELTRGYNSRSSTPTLFLQREKKKMGRPRKQPPSPEVEENSAVGCPTP